MEGEAFPVGTQAWNKPLFVSSSIFCTLMLYNLFFVKITKDNYRMEREQITLGDGGKTVDAKHLV